MERLLTSLNEPEEKQDIEEQESPPAMTDPRWEDYVLSLLTPEELDENKRPKTCGLRRIARLLCGAIVASKANVVRPPELVQEVMEYKDGKLVNSRRGFQQICTVEYTVKFLWTLDLPEGMPAIEVEFTDCAEVFEGNCDAKYLIYASRTAATIAEGRCLRKALQLKTIAAEEVSLPFDEPNGLISSSTITLMKALASRLKVDLDKCVKKFGKYASIEEMPASVGQKMFQRLSELQNTTIPDDIKINE